MHLPSILFLISTASEQSSLKNVRKCEKQVLPDSGSEVASIKKVTSTKAELKTDLLKGKNIQKIIEANSTLQY